MAKIYKTPGVYIEEKSAFPNSAVPVPTAVPAFVGYTEKAIRDKQSLHLQPTKISSFGEYLQYFGGPAKTTYTINSAETLDYSLTATKQYFALHQHMKMFFSNGGTDCYIVSVGEYDEEAAAAVKADNIDLEDLRKGIAPLQKEPEVTMLVIPEAVMVEVDPDHEDRLEKVVEIYLLYQEVLSHCGAEMRNRFAILDVWMDRTKYESDDYSLADDIKLFRDRTGTNHLQWGAAYFPWLHTTAVSRNEVTLANVDNLGDAATDILFIEDTQLNEEGDLRDVAAFRAAFDKKYGDTPDLTLTALLDKSLCEDILAGLVKAKRGQAIKEELKKIPTLSGMDSTGVKGLHQALLAVSPVYKGLLRDIQKELNLLPPSAAMAGIFSMVDNTVGVWQSPANVSVGSVVSLAVNITSDQQEDMNLPLTGKAVNAIRSFPGKGVLVWGARTLDGNSQDWRYISVRRTVIFIEQSVRYAVEPYVFQQNDAATWANVKALITNFLTNVWQSGALAGATPEDAFSVDVGLGTTMTPVDILDGYMRVVIKIAVTRPAEFIVITFQQKMQQS